jgi:hypothetical protein
MLSAPCLSLIALAAAAVPSVKASIVRRSVAATGETTLAVVVQATELVLGAYQGRFRYDPGSFSVVSAITPSGDGMRVFNAADTAKGVIRFGGYTVSSTGFKSQDVLVLVVRTKRSLDTAKLAVDLDVATDLQGKGVPASRLIPAKGLSSEPVRH